MTMQTYCFTFGQVHTHPETGKLLRDYWVEISADSSEKARAKMIEMFGLKWGMQFR